MLCPECGEHTAGHNKVNGVAVCDVCFQRHCIDLQLKQIEEEDNGNA